MTTATVDLVQTGDKSRRSRTRKSVSAVLFFGAIGALMIAKPATQAPAPVSASPRVMNFKLQPVGSTSQQAITFLNGGTTSFHVTSVVIDGGLSNAFTASADDCREIAAGQRCTALVSFAPAAARTYEASLVLASENARSETVALQGAAFVEPPAGSARLTAKPLQATFDPQPVGSTTTKPIEMTNEGNADFVLTGIAMDGANSSGAYTISADPCSRVAPRQTCVATVSFTPPSIGQHVASIALLAGSNRSETLQVEGSGVPAVEPPAPQPLLVATPPAITIGPEQKFGSLRIENRGTGRLHINSIVFNGTRTSVPLSGCPDDLDAGAACQITVFRTSSGTIRIDSSAPATPTIVPVTVEAPPVQLTPLLVPDPASVTLDPRQKGGTLQILNRGRGVLRINAITLQTDAASTPILTCLGEMLPDGNCTMRVPWPRGGNPRIRIDSNTPASPTLVPVIVPVVESTPRIDVPKTLVIGLTEKQGSLVIGNRGRGVLRINSITAEFRARQFPLKGCNEVAPGGSCTVAVPRTATQVRIDSNSQGSPTFVPVVLQPLY